MLHNYTHDLIPQIKSKLLPGEDRNLVYVGYCFLLVAEQVSKYPAIEFGIYLDTLIVWLRDPDETFDTNGYEKIVKVEFS